MPEPAPTVAFDVLLLLHTPPPGNELRVMAEPVHTNGVPLMADGAAVTETTLTEAQPVPVTV
jgi:hypothetical protein